MKQKIICIVLLTAGLYIPAPSKECTKIFTSTEIENGLQAKEQVSTPAEEDAIHLPASPFGNLLFNM